MITRPADLAAADGTAKLGTVVAFAALNLGDFLQQATTVAVTSAWPSRRDRKLGMDNTRATELLIGDGGENHHPVVDRERRLGGCGHRLGVVAALGYS